VLRLSCFHTQMLLGLRYRPWRRTQGYASDCESARESVHWLTSSIRSGHRIDLEWYGSGWWISLHKHWMFSFPVLIWLVEFNHSKPIIQKPKLVDSHVYPEGEFTGMTVDQYFKCVKIISKLVFSMGYINGTTVLLLGCVCDILT